MRNIALREVWIDASKFLTHHWVSVKKKTQIICTVRVFFFTNLTHAHFTDGLSKSSYINSTQNPRIVGGIREELPTLSIRKTPIQKDLFQHPKAMAFFSASKTNQ